MLILSRFLEDNIQSISNSKLLLHRLSIFWDICTPFFFFFSNVWANLPPLFVFNFQTHVSACFPSVFCWIIIVYKDRKPCIQQQVQTTSKGLCLFLKSCNSVVAFPITYPKSISRRTVAAKFFRKVKADSWKALITPTHRVTGIM